MSLRSTQSSVQSILMRNQLFCRHRNYRTNLKNVSLYHLLNLNFFSKPLQNTRIPFSPSPLIVLHFLSEILQEYVIDSSMEVIGKKIQMITFNLNNSYNSKSLWTYNAYNRGGEGPADLPADPGVVADHLLDAIIEPVYTEGPGHGDALEEYEEQEWEATDRVRVQYLEYVHAAL